jgi:hypothetical protein
MNRKDTTREVGRAACVLLSILARVVGVGASGDHCGLLDVTDLA